MLVNALRAYLAELGIVGAQGMHRICDLVVIVTVTDDTDPRVPAIARHVLQIVANQIAVLQNEIAAIDGRILIWHRSNEVSQRLAGMPGVGPIVAWRSQPAYPMRRCSAVAESLPPGWA